METHIPNDTEPEVKMLHDSIFTRKSCRSYDMTPLSDEELSQLLDTIATLKKLDPSVTFSTHILGPADVRGIFKADAPHYLVISGNGSAGESLNAGFLLEQWALHLSAQGYGCIWLGATKPKTGDSGDKTIATIAFGKTVGPHTRTLAEFNRKSLAEIATGETHLLEAARLAPSAINAQPWRFIVEKTERREDPTEDGPNRKDPTEEAPVIHIYNKRFAIDAVFSDHSELDMGIMLSHLYLAYQNEGLPFRFDRDAKCAPKPPSGCEYFGTVRSM
ncbi:MAG: hypothetical protein HGA54_01300 [Actinobacteria bacterium]|nr:hypothetical protein [Actinomycetota bacterium]